MVNVGVARAGGQNINRIEDRTSQSLRWGHSHVASQSREAGDGRVRGCSSRVDGRSKSGLARAEHEGHGLSDRLT